MVDFFLKNRIRFAEKMENSGVLVLFSGYAPVKRGDEFYPFAAQRNFYYLTGLAQPNLVFVMIKNSEGEATCTLYIERQDEYATKWTGKKLDSDEAKVISGIDNYKFIDELNDAVATLFVRGITTMYSDMENRSLTLPLSMDIDFVNLVKTKFPYINIVNAYPIFTGLRVIKAPEEISLLKKAIAITGDAFKAMLSNAKDGMAEYELEAYFDYTVKKVGAGRAFQTIMASGKNAAVLHYHNNNTIMKDGGLVLMDFGAQYDWYSADVSRTFPVNGKFTERQRELYEIVLGGNKHVINQIKPGVPFKRLNESLLEYYEIELIKIGLIKDKSEIGEFYYHGVSHMLGLETHDIGRGAETELQPGMVLTVEPGLYLLNECIGIRIEDDVLVTETGCEVLTADIIKEVDDIENFMGTK